MSLHSHVKIGFMDDVIPSGDLPTVERDIITITNAYAEADLSEIIMEDDRPAATVCPRPSPPPVGAEAPSAAEQTAT